MPDTDFTREIGGHFDRETWSFNAVLPSPTPPPPLVSNDHVHPCMVPKSPYFDVTSHAIRRITCENPQPDTGLMDDDDLAHLTLADNLKNLSIESTDYRFLGKSSGAMLIQTAIDLKNVYNGREAEPPKPQFASRRPHFWGTLPVGILVSYTVVVPNVK